MSTERADAVSTRVGCNQPGRTPECGAAKSRTFLAFGCLVLCLEAREDGSGRQPSRSSSRAAVGRFLPPPLASAALIANTTPQANRIPRHHCPWYSRPAQRYICMMTGTVLLSSSLPGRTDLRCSVSKRLPGAYVCVLLSYFISSACDVAASNCADPRFPLTEFGHQGSHECLPPQTPPPRRPPSHRTTHPTQLLRPLRTPFIR